MPEVSLGLEKAYVIDLDRKTLGRNNVCHFRLEAPPDSKTLYSLTDQGTRDWSGLELRLAHPCIATNALPVETEYMKLEPQLMAEPSGLKGNAEALISAIEYFQLLSCEIHLFRELCYPMLMVASCSPDHLMLVDAAALHLPDGPYLAVEKLSSFKYGIRPGSPKTLVSSFLSDFHEPGKAPGSAPPETSYWIGPVLLVRLEYDLPCRTRFPAAITAAIAYGRAEKRVFRAVVCSLRYLVLIRVSFRSVIHSKRYSLLTKRPYFSPLYAERINIPEPALNVSNQGGSDNSDWVAPQSGDEFRILARFFIKSDSMTDRDPDLLRTAEEKFEHKKPFTRLRRGWQNPKSFHVRCILLLGAGSSTSTPSFIAVPVPWERVLPPQTLTTALELESAPEFPSLDLPRPPEIDISRARAPTGALLEASLASPDDGHLIPGYEISLAVVYGLIFFVPSGVAGCGNDGLEYLEYLGKVLYGQVARRVWLNTKEGHISTYFVALYKPASEDSAEGWARAEKEARKQAELEYIREAFILWIKKKDTAMHDLAVSAIIGTKFKVLHVTKHPRITLPTFTLMDLPGWESPYTGWRPRQRRKVLVVSVSCSKLVRHGSHAQQRSRRLLKTFRSTQMMRNKRCMGVLGLRGLRGFHQNLDDRGPQLAARKKYLFRAEACVTATRHMAKGEVIDNLCGKRVPLSDKELGKLVEKKKNFSAAGASLARR
ncbi:hypothetical protein B0T24DRAFT_712042 [Lasiosphaeria ovina]|uniref:Uncharacterized protein n=1 Tax=Lasiosphaeria ovina TaxID=92902 RepID=A0AAE0MZ03_9PEZI|nr:hypothetical protein B0T24DRAFT_712042 [Lasiosphaeria ovina]